MAPDLNRVGNAGRQSVSNSLDDLGHDLGILSSEDFDQVFDAFENAFTNRRTFLNRLSQSSASLDHGLARCPALDDLIGALDASGEDECVEAGIFRKRTGGARRFAGKASRQFPCAEINKTP